VKSEYNVRKDAARLGAELGAVFYGSRSLTRGLLRASTRW